MVRSWYSFLPLLAFSVLLGLIRVCIYDLALIGLLWNIVLAAIPFLLTLVFLKYEYPLFRWFIFLFWILFLPNSFYVITDFVHLYFASHTLSFDIVFITSVFLVSTLMGLRSLSMMHGYLAGKWGTRIAWFCIYLIICISVFGVFIGRFLRLNSWDVLTHPLEVLHEVWNMSLSNGSSFLIHEPSRLSEHAVFSIGTMGLLQYITLYSVFFMVLYTTISHSWKSE